MMASGSGDPSQRPGTMGPQFFATRQANRVSEATDMKTKIKDIDIPELSGSESSKMINADMEDVLQKSAKQLSKRASLMDQPKNITELVLPRKKLFFFTVPPQELIKWTSKPLKKPLSEVAPEFDRDALKCFSAIQRYMKDRPADAEGKGDTSDIRFVTDRGMCVVGLRSEIYLQLYKQLNVNPRPESLLRGWQVMCILTNCFTPAKPLWPIINAFLMEKALPKEEVERHLETGDWKSLKGVELDKVKIGLMARYALNKLTIITRAPKSRVPSLEEIDHFLAAPFKFNVFGETLQNIVKNPQNLEPETKLPQVLSFLSEAVLLLNGHAAEGIFRVPGDLDCVISLKMRIERGEYNLDGINDPAIPASLLKMWVRELAEPVIPNSFYERCLKTRQVQAAMDIVDELPELNRRVIKYLAKYLQIVGDPVNQPKTKMTVSNLAIVFAPNLLRCPDDNPLVILQNSKREQHFVKIIVNYLDE